MLSDPYQLFQLTSPLAMLGWLALVLSPLAPRLAQWVAALVIPALLSVAYTALILVHWADAPGGFDSLANVMALFTDPPVALAGWVHYLAFDLFVGAWITRTARAEAISHLLILPCLVLTFLFGPAGLLAFLILRAGFTLRARMTGVPA
ncbi:MAG: DUF4281 domain-containing protein [Rhodobacter sp.]|nr:DUF4281 domain-containing protein [Rhodobacter sp.]